LPRTEIAFWLAVDSTWSVPLATLFNGVGGWASGRWRPRRKDEQGLLEVLQASRTNVAARSQSFCMREALAPGLTSWIAAYRWPVLKSRPMPGFAGTAKGTGRPPF